MASLTNLAGTAELILARFVAHLTAQGIDVPERQYVNYGQQPVWDGEQLVVSLLDIGAGQPGITIGTTPVPQALVLAGRFAVDMLRAIPVIDAEGPFALAIPSALQLDAAGQQLLTDAGGLAVAAAAIHTGYELTDPGQGFTFEISPFAPTGGLGGHRLTLNLSLD